MKKVFQLFDLLLALCVLAGCGDQTIPAPTPTPAVASVAPTEDQGKTLVVAANGFEGQFSPFFAQNVEDQNVADLTSLTLMGYDREGSPVLRGIEGETRSCNGTDYTYTGPADIEVTENEDGTVFYDITMRDDIRFSDGTPADIDDVIFGIYVLCDPTYDGPATLCSCPIEGLEAYRAGVSTVSDPVSVESDSDAETETADHISGVQRTGDYSLRIVATEMNASMLDQMALPIVPLHDYGDESKYDYERHQFGFDKGDLSTIRSKQPMGAGPYRFLDYTNGTVHLEANPYYYKGEPKTKYLNLTEIPETEQVTSIAAGTADIAASAYSAGVAGAVAGYNGGDSLDGSVITTRLMDCRGYGYIGISADLVKVGDDPGSEPSKDLRKAIATVLAAGREESVSAYYGSTASVINYPISNTSWAAPQTTDEGYQTAYSVDETGEPIYTDGMSQAEKFDAALQAALGYFAAAGYTVEDGKLTDAPEGAKLAYQVNLDAGGNGDHPAFLLLQKAANALATIGFTLEINDLASPTDLYASYQSGKAELWCAAWQAAADPDLFQRYHAQGTLNYDRINDGELDSLIEEARMSADQTLRKDLYQSAMEIVLDWGVEVPVYQRAECCLFSTQRVDISTLPADMTPYWGWASEIERIVAR